MSNPYIDALLVERAGYVARGLTNRVKAVDEALRDAGYEKKETKADKEVASVEQDVERAVAPVAKRRRVAGNGDN